jgi:hypothetical protein
MLAAPASPASILSVQNRVRDLKAVAGKFFAELAKYTPPPQLGPSFSVSPSGEIKTEFLSHTVSATPRLVRSSDNEYLFEWHFTSQIGEDTIPLWRFYLTPGGVVTRTSEPNSSFGDYDNPSVPQIILLSVAGAIIESPLLAPSQ